MKNLFAMALVSSLLLAGCAGKKAIEDQAIREAPPAVAEQEAPEPKPAPALPSEVAPAPVAKLEATQAAEKIFFDFDSYLLTPASKDALDGNALWLKEQREVRIVIEGHADERGSDTYNMVLGDNRARAARDYLVGLGIESDRIAVLSYGEEKATKGTANEAIWAEDRRAEFVRAN